MDKAREKICCPGCKESFSEPSTFELHLKKYKRCQYASTNHQMECQRKVDIPKETQDTKQKNDTSEVEVRERNCKGYNKPFKCTAG